MKNMFFCPFIIGLAVYAAEAPFLTEPPAILVWEEHNGFGSNFEKTLIVAVWNNGDMLWSTNTVSGGKPYLYNKVNASNDVHKLLASFQAKGYLSPEFSKLIVGPEASCTRIVISSGTNVLNTGSWHEIFERNQNLVALSTGIRALKKGESREAALKKDKAEYLQYRAMWTDIRSQINIILPEKGSPIEDVEIRRQIGNIPAVTILREQNE